MVNGTVTGNGGGLDYQAGDYRLTAASPCVDAGWTFRWMARTTDITGFPRVVRGGSPGGAAIADMGAYERPPQPGTILLLGKVDIL